LSSSSSSSSSSLSSSSSSSSSSLSSSSSFSSHSSSSYSNSSSTSTILYECDDCIDAWELSKWYSCNNAAHPVHLLSEVEIGDCVEFNQGGERMWGMVMDMYNCNKIIVVVLTDLQLSHPFSQWDRVIIEIKHIYNLDKECQNL
jgi:hypothetical protein